MAALSSYGRRSVGLVQKKIKNKVSNNKLFTYFLVVLSGRYEARENVCERITSGFTFSFDWLNSTNCFGTQVKTAPKSSSYIFELSLNECLLRVSTVE